MSFGFKGISTHHFEESVGNLLDFGDAIDFVFEFIQKSKYLFLHL
jgi:hypothetical protein